MSTGAAEPPKLLIVTQDPAWEARYRKALDAFPFAEKETAPGADSSQVCLVDARIAREFPAMLEAGSDALYVLANSVAVSPEPLSIEEKVALFEMGYSLVSEGPDSLPSLRVRLQALLALKSKLLAQQIVNKRLRMRIESQSNNIKHQSDFLHMAVHDLRSPLAAMICYAELLMEGVLGNLQATQLEPIRTIHRNCQFLIDMVTDLLDSAKIGAGKLQLKLEKVDFNKEVELAVQSLRGLANAKNIQIEFALEPVQDMYLDVQKVSRVLSNILGNAIKFTKANGKIVVRSKQQDNVLALSIQDTGPGIAPADLEAIFEKFHTGAGSNLAGKGHGLGLAISKSFVELHGGRLFVESTRHKGSVFIVHLPVEKRKASAMRQTQRRLLILDLGRDMPGLKEAAAEVELGNFQVDYVSAPLRDWNKTPLPRFDFLLINEAPGFEEFGRDYYLLGLSELSADARCALLINSGMSVDDQDVRRYLGFQLLEKPCTPKELFDRLQGIVGFDRRQRNK
ncbi:MAG: HAMP domain-containing histidine kinase [Fibrobacterota bacterium]|nr:HAMP domain-containing histidine kinase [Fibrobacterota bacterium]